MDLHLVYCKSGLMVHQTIYCQHCCNNLILETILDGWQYGFYWRRLFLFIQKRLCGHQSIHFCFLSVCWYAKGNGIIAIVISSVIIGVLFSQAFLITQGFYVTHLLEVITWGIGVIILHRKPKEYALQIGLSLVVAFVHQLIVPYWG